jgi:nicotinate-nucleotide adenylyltransferase
MGGTFDPIHIGHLIAASEALRAFQLEQVLFVPTGEPWQKSNYSDAEDRFLMTSLAAALHPSFAASRIELDRPGPTFTRETLKTLKAFFPDETSIFVILGADAVQGLDTWNGVEELAALCEVIAVTRPGSDLASVEEREGWPRLHKLTMPEIGISATDIRERVRAGAPIDFLVPAPVVRYIKEQGLYVGAPAEVAGA